MPFYEVVCISKVVSKDIYKDLLRLTASHVMDNNGVVRGFGNLGSDLELWKRIKSHREWHYRGNYWTMKFHASPETMQSLSRKLEADSRVIKATMIKIAEQLPGIAERPRLG